MAAGQVESSAFRSLSYGLFVLTAREGEKDNGCIINTMAQITTSPNRISICVNKGGLTHDMVLRTGVFNVSVLTESTPFDLFQHFGFQSGKNTEKFVHWPGAERSGNGVLHLTQYANAVICGKVASTQDWGTHTLFVADVTEARVLSSQPSVTYAYYFEHIKPKPAPQLTKKKGWVCKICGYVYEGETLPPDFVCPLCKHGPEDFEPIG